MSFKQENIRGWNKIMNNVSEKNTFLYIDMDRLAQYSENAAKTIAVSGEISARKSASTWKKAKN